MYFMRQSGAGITLRRQMLEGRTNAGGDGLRWLGLGVIHSDDAAKDHGLVIEAGEGGQIEIGLGGFDRDLLDPDSRRKNGSGGQQ